MSTTGAEASYRENHVLLRWPVVVLGLGLPLLAGPAFVIGRSGLVHLVAAVGLGYWFGWPMIWLIRYWPTGLRVDETGVRFGGVRRAERLAGRRRPPRRQRGLPYATMQAHQLFACPWEAVELAEVVTGRAQVRALHKRSEQVPGSAYRGRRLVRESLTTGMIVPPFARAALVLRLRPGAVTPPAFREQPQVASASSWTWVAPTRHPDRLRRALPQGALPRR